MDELAKRRQVSNQNSSLQCALGSNVPPLLSPPSCNSVRLVRKSSVWLARLRRRSCPDPQRGANDFLISTCTTLTDRRVVYRLARLSARTRHIRTRREIRRERDSRARARAHVRSSLTEARESDSTTRIRARTLPLFLRPSVRPSVRLSLSLSRFSARKRLGDAHTWRFRVYDSRSNKARSPRSVGR